VRADGAPVRVAAAAWPPTAVLDGVAAVAADAAPTVLTATTEASPSAAAAATTLDEAMKEREGVDTMEAGGGVTTLKSGQGRRRGGGCRERTGGTAGCAGVGMEMGDVEATVGRCPQSGPSSTAREQTAAAARRAVPPGTCRQDSHAGGSRRGAAARAGPVAPNYFPPEAPCGRLLRQ